MMKLRCLVSLQRVAGWMGISTEDEADLDKEIRATADTSSNLVDAPSPAESITDITAASSTTATRDGSPYLDASDRSVPSPPHDESHCGGLFDRPPLRDPRFPSPPNHHSPDAIPRPRVRISKSDDYPSPAVDVRYPQDQICTSLDLNVERTGPSTTSESTISSLDLANDTIFSPASPSTTLETHRRHSIELPDPSSIPAIVVEEAAEVQQEEVGQKIEMRCEEGRAKGSTLSVEG